MTDARDHEEPSSLGGRIRARRLALGLTQEDLARRAGVPLVTVNRIENGHQRPRRQTLLKLARALGAEPAELLLED